MGRQLLIFIRLIKLLILNSFLPNEIFPSQRFFIVVYIVYFLTYLFLFIVLVILFLLSK